MPVSRYIKVGCRYYSRSERNRINNNRYKSVKKTMETKLPNEFNRKYKPIPAKKSILKKLIELFTNIFLRWKKRN